MKNIVTLAAWGVNRFVRDNDFTGKTVISFCTSSSSDLGESGTHLAEMAGTGDWQEGMRSRACLKNHSCHLHAPLCVIFAPNSGYIARYAPFIWHKSPTNCDAHLAKSIFQTRSSGSTGEILPTEACRTSMAEADFLRKTKQSWEGFLERIGKHKAGYIGVFKKYLDIVM